MLKVIEIPQKLDFSSERLSVELQNSLVNKYKSLQKEHGTELSTHTSKTGTYDGIDEAQSKGSIFLMVDMSLNKIDENTPVLAGLCLEGYADELMDGTLLPKYNKEVNVAHVKYLVADPNYSAKLPGTKLQEHLLGKLGKRELEIKVGGRDYGQSHLVDVIAGNITAMNAPAALLAAQNSEVNFVARKDHVITTDKGKLIFCAAVAKGKDISIFPERYNGILDAIVFSEDELKTLASEALSEYKLANPSKRGRSRGRSQ